MKRTLTNIILAFGSAFVCAAGLHAQTYTLKADVPFTFQAGGKTHEAGRYIVERPSTTPVLLLRNSSQTKKIVLGMATAGATGKGPARLTFHRYGNEAFLAQVWNSEHSGTVLPVSAKEKEVRQSARGSEMAVITVTCDTGAKGL